MEIVYDDEIVILKLSYADVTNKFMHDTNLKINLTDEDYLDLEDFKDKLNTNLGISELLKKERKIKPENYEIPNGINNKFQYNDSRFFITFTNNSKDRPV